MLTWFCLTAESVVVASHSAQTGDRGNVHYAAQLETEAKGRISYEDASTYMS